MLVSLCVLLSVVILKLNDKVSLLTVLFEDSQTGEALQGQFQISLLMELQTLHAENPVEAAKAVSAIVCSSTETLDDYLALSTVSENAKSTILQTKEDVLEHCGN
mgnify:FL=1